MLESLKYDILRKWNFDEDSSGVRPWKWSEAECLLDGIIGTVVTAASAAVTAALLWPEWRAADVAAGMTLLVTIFFGMGTFDSFVGATSGRRERISWERRQIVSEIMDS